MVPDANSEGLVLNYTYTLSQFLRAIYILLTVIGSLAPTRLSGYGATLRSCLNRLSLVHGEIVQSGIVGSRIPEPHEVGHVYRFPELSGGSYWESNWYGTDHLMWPFGAIERYSGASLMKSYSANFSDPTIDPDVLDDAMAHNFFALLVLRIT